VPLPDVHLGGPATGAAPGSATKATTGPTQPDGHHPDVAPATTAADPATTTPGPPATSTSHQAPAGTTGATNALPGHGLAGTRMSTRERIWILLRYWAWHGWSGMRGRWSATHFYQSPPGPSLAEHDKWTARHEWVPDGYDGTTLIKLGEAYHKTIARFAIVTGRGYIRTMTSPLRLTTTLLLITGFALWIQYG
jgi:hypothetical protein